MSSKSMIHYPNRKKNVPLPKLVETSARVAEVLPPIPLPEVKPFSNFTLPEIENDEDSIDLEWIRLQQRTIETMVSKLAHGKRIKILVGMSSRELSEVVISESITLVHLHTCGGTIH
jgi:hypothetical protein